ncbi:hypothetical protein N657DRAFT_676803 [Parathielavia appendiculata]|uniref:Uncharacterized protein n=1 Tax=Parathielavia appendiculata TaxID=2587402 RepID=A0AAN6U9X1_9PEZI|nr:hypothetical protein N657DRAFT_676803 [Parathielavia appendiculata]
MLTSAHFFRLVPVVFTVSALILALLALCAGNTPGVLDTYDIITIYTSDLGNKTYSKASENTFAPSRTTTTECDNVGGLLSPLCSSMTSAASSALSPPTTSTSKAGDEINDINNGMADMPATPPQKRHIRDFYSMYALTVCEGDFMPNGRRNIIQCHHFFSENEASTIPCLIETALNLGGPGQNLSLFSLGFTYPLESALDSLNMLLKAVGVIFSIGIGFAGLSFLSSIPAVSLKSASKGMGYMWSVWINLVFVSAALFFLILGGLIAAIGAKVAERKVNDLGVAAGVFAVARTSWVTLAWAGIALMVMALLYWIGRAVHLKKVQREADEEEQKEASPPPSSPSIYTTPRDHPHSVSALSAPGLPPPSQPPLSTSSRR